MKKRWLPKIYYYAGIYLPLILFAFPPLALWASPLHEAAKNGNISEIKKLVANGEDVASRDEEALTALHWASIRGKLTVAEFLIENGADINAIDSFGTTVLHMAIFGGEKMVQLLLNKYVDVNKKNYDGAIALHIVALEGNWNIAAALISRGSEVNTKTTKNQITPLYWAAKRGHKDIVELLINNGANVNPRTKRGKTPLSAAIKKGRRAVAELLWEHGARE